MPKSFKWYFYLVLLAPIVGYFSYYYFFGFLARQTLAYLVIPVFFVFLGKSNFYIIVPKFIFPYVLYIVYIYIWRTQNGYFEAKGFLKFIFNNYHLYFVFILLIIYNTELTEHIYLNCVKLIKVILIVALIGAIIQFFRDPTWMIRPIGWEGDLESIYLNRRPSVFTYVSDNDYGVSVLAFFSLIISIHTIHKNRTWLLIFVIIIGLYSLLTNTRYIMIGFALVLVQLLMNKDIAKKFGYIFYITIGLVIIYLIFVNILGVDFQELGKERLFAEGSIKETTRYGAYINFLHFFPEKPIFGTGVHLTDEIRAASNAIGSSQIHVGYLSHLISYGLVGSILLFYFWYSLARDLFRKAKLTSYYGPFFALLVFLWANVTFVDFDLYYPGIIIAILFSEYYFKNNFKQLINNGKSTHRYT